MTFRPYFDSRKTGNSLSIIFNEFILTTEDYNEITQLMDRYPNRTQVDDLALKKIIPI